MLNLKRAFAFVFGASLVTQTAAFAPIASKNSHVQLQMIEDEVVDVDTRNARIMAPLSAVAASMLPLSTIVAPASAASSSPFEAGMRKSFPGSLPNSAVALRVASALKDRGYTATNTLFASSVCSDEINDTADSIVADLQNKMQVDGVFNLGGLGGLPFVGITGMGAFLSHCPEQGKVFIVFGPHVGIDAKGVVGTVERIGQDGPHTSCGAGIGAYKAIMGKPVSDDDMAFIGTKDFQEEYIIAKLRDRLDPLRGKEPGDEAITYVTNKMYDLVWEMLRGEINAYTTKDGFWKNVSEVTLLGGIVVNRGHGQGTPGGEDFFQPLMLKSLTQAKETDLYGEVFGDFPALAAPHRDAKFETSRSLLVEMSSDDSENWVLGVTLGLLGSIAINTGNNIQSLGLKQAQGKVTSAEPSTHGIPDKDTAPLPKKHLIPWLSPKGIKTAPYDNDDEFSVVTVAKQSPLLSLTWIIGTFIFVTGSLLNFASYAFAAQSMLASLESIQFVTNLLFGKFMLGARVTQTMLVGTMLTVIGTVMAVQFSSKETLELNTADIKKLYSNPAYISYLCLMVLALVVLHVVYKKLEERKNRDKPLKSRDVIMPCLYSVWSALFGTQSVVQAKVLAELLAVHSSGTENIFTSSFTYATILLWVMTVLVWLKRLNDALQKFNPLFIIPLLQCSFIFFAIISGGIFFKEFNSFDSNQWIGFWFGIIVMFGGLVLLTPQPIQSEVDLLHRDLVNLILEQRGSFASNQTNSVNSSTGCSVLSPQPEQGLVTPRNLTRSLDESQSKNKSIPKSPIRSPRFSKENMTKVAFDVVRDVVGETATLFYQNPSTKVLSNAMCQATADADDKRWRRKLLEKLLCMIKENPLSANGYSDEIMNLINDLNLTDAVTISPPGPERDIKTQLTMTQEKLSSTIEMEIQQSITPRVESLQPARDLSIRFNEIT